jgi:multisubunit Na+/H+ antiporter MnhC subunit
MSRPILTAIVVGTVMLAVVATLTQREAAIAQAQVRNATAAIDSTITQNAQRMLEEGMRGLPSSRRS